MSKFSCVHHPFQIPNLNQSRNVALKLVITLKLKEIFDINTTLLCTCRQNKSPHLPIDSSISLCEYYKCEVLLLSS